MLFRSALLYSLIGNIVRPAELHSRSAEKNCLTENVSSLRSVKGATLPCDACASIPCGLAVRIQHEMLFASSKFERKYFNLAKERKCMSKAILAAIVSLVLGVLAEASVGVRWNMTGIGCIVSVAIMGAFIIYFNDKKE